MAPAGGGGARTGEGGDLQRSSGSRMTEKESALADRDLGSNPTALSYSPSAPAQRE